MSTIIAALRDYLKEYEGLKNNAPVWVNYLDTVPTQYSVVPLAGDKIVESYIDGSSLREFPFAFQSSESTAADLARLENIGFYEALSDWFESQTNNGDLPTLGTNKTAESIEAIGWGFLFDQGNSETGIYQIQCKLTYKQEV